MLSARAARSYLADLGVPLAVWTAAPGTPVAALDWGGGTDVRTRSALRAAVRSLETALGEQRIVWVEGTHLPQSIQLSGRAPAGLTLVR